MTYTPPTTTTTNLHDGYRLTELGPLPEEWRVVRLGEIFSMANRKLREIIVQEEVTYRLLTVRLYAKGIVLREAKKGADIGTKKLYAVKEGDFVFSKIDARNGAWGFVDQRLSGALVSGDFPILLLNRTISDANFVMLSLSRSSSWEMLRNFAVGTTNRRRIQPKELLSALSIPLPPLPEQRAIAHVLRAVQQAKEATEQVIAAARELKKSLMRHLFTYGPVPADQADAVEMQETEIGLLPAHWRVVRLGEVVTRSFSGGTPSTKIAEYWGGSIPWTTSAIISDDEVFLIKFQRTISGKGLQNSSSKIAPKGSVIVGTRVGVGKAAVATFDIAISQDLTALVLTEDISPLFLAYLFKSDSLKEEIAERTRGTTIKGIPRKDLLNLSIPLPPLPEQREIVRILQVVDEKIRAEEARKTALEALFKTLLHDLMTAKRRLPAEFIARFAEAGDESL